VIGILYIPVLHARITDAQQQGRNIPQQIDPERHVFVPVSIIATNKTKLSITESPSVYQRAPLASLYTSYRHSHHCPLVAATPLSTSGPTPLSTSGPTPLSTNGSYFRHCPLVAAAATCLLRAWRGAGGGLG